MKVMEMIVKLSPVGVFCLIAPVIAENGPEVLKSTTTPLRWFFTLNGGLAFRF